MVTVPKFTGTPEPGTGRVIYTVDKIGAFTIGYDRPADGGPAEGAYLRVDYGRRLDGKPWRPCHDDLLDEPVVNRITVTGACVFSRDRLRAVEDRRPGAWVRASRRRAEDGYPVPVPDGTADRVGKIVAALASDYLARPDHDDLRAAWARTWAQDRVREYRRQEQDGRDTAAAATSAADAAAATAARWEALLVDQAAEAATS